MIVDVNVDSKIYKVNVGLGIINDIINLDIVEQADKSIILVSFNVYNFHSEKIDLLVSSIDNCYLEIMQDSEKNKNYKYAEGFFNRFIEIGLTRNSIVIAVGGGVVGDFGGFLSSMYMRGIKVIQVPTTVLSMVDSSVGGKVAVNMTKGKNIIGSFHQPSAVFAEIEFLKTLSQNIFCDGLVESLKHGLIGDSETLEIFKKNDLETIRNNKVIENLVIRSVKFKGSVVEEDEHEGGVRAILNFGHTTAHAIESLMEYKGIAHGEAVAIGILVALELSYRKKWISESEVKEIDEIITKYKLIRISLDLDSEEIIHHMSYDKKNKNNKINFVLLNGIGNPKYDQNVDLDIINESVTFVLNKLKEKL